MLATIQTLAAIATPVLLAILAGLGWLIQNRLQSNQAKELGQIARIRELEDKLREDRIHTYNALLEPFFLLFTSEAAFATDKKFKGRDKNEVAIAQMLSVEYRQVGFKLSLVASDEVVRSYNRIMQFFYHTEEDSHSLETKTSLWVGHMATLLLEIRKSMGNETSGLDRWEMIEWFMKDAEVMKANALSTGTATEA